LIPGKAKRSTDFMVGRFLIATVSVVTSYRGIAMMVIDDYLMTMKNVRVAELKARLSEYLRSVQGGHEITVYDRDRPIARIVPYAPGGVLSVREPTRTYRTLGDIELPSRAKLDVDAVELLLADRRSEE
jgi:prevent-host-death family protein